MANKYISKYSNGKLVTCSQYITEIICEHKAKIDKKDLHYRFWVNKEWASFYRNQIASANKLVKEYDCKAIIAALKNKKCERTYSLRSPILLEIIKTEQKKLEKQQPLQAKEYNRDIGNNHKRKSNNKKNILSKLKEIEDEQD